MSPRAAFELHEVSYDYRDVPAIDRLSLRIETGQRIALLGANGSGKSTLLRLLDALYFPASGTISAFGETLTESAFQEDAFLLRFRRRVGYVFQDADTQLFNPMVFDELAFGPLQLGWPKDRIRACVDRMLATMGITHLKNRAPYRLSGGEKKRVAIASVLVMDPDVLLLDEPTAGLDPESQSQIIDLLAGWRGSGKTIVTATHDLGTIEDIADHCCILESGRLAAQDTPARILKNTELLARTRLIHTHRHRHADGTLHSHPHVHGHAHPHDSPGDRANVGKS